MKNVGPIAAARRIVIHQVSLATCASMSTTTTTTTRDRLDRYGPMDGPNKLRRKSISLIQSWLMTAFQSKPVFLVPITATVCRL